jgi:hypothetical protein
MLERIDAPGNVLAFRAVGRVEKSDYETALDPAVEAMIAEQGEVRFVYVLGDTFDSYSVGATWEDAKLGVEHASKWKRIAVVTDHDWVRHVVGMFGWMVPGDVKAFPADEERSAIEWAAG